MSFYDGDSTGIHKPLTPYEQVRVSSPRYLINCGFRWGKRTIDWSESTASGGTVTANSNRGSVDLAATTTTNSQAIFQSRKHAPLSLGQSCIAYIGGSFVETATNVVKRFGVFNEDNGAFFQLSSSTLSVVYRTKVTGSVVDTTIAQSSWNLDTMSSSGDSTIVIDVTKFQCFVIEISPSFIKYGFMVDEKIIYCHRQSLLNSLSNQGLQAPSLPIRASILNSSATSSSCYISFAKMIIDGSVRNTELTKSIYSYVFTSYNKNVIHPVISIRKSAANIQGVVRLINMIPAVDNARDVVAFLVLNGSLTGASWSSAGVIVESDVSATVISGGTVLYSDYLRGNNNTVSRLTLPPLNSEIVYYLGHGISGDSDIISLCIIGAADGTRMLYSVNFEEIY